MVSEIASCKEIIELLLPLNLSLSSDERLKLLELVNNRQVSLAIQHHLISMHHVAKIVSKYHKIPATPYIRRMSQPEGVFLHKIYQLCKELHPFISGYYESGYYWFLAINKEILNGKIKQILHPYEFIKKPKNGNKKRELANIYNQELSAIKNCINPYENDINISNYSILIGLTIKYSQESAHFKKIYFNPFISAGRDLVNSHYSSDWCVVSRRYGQTTKQGVGGHKQLFLNS